VILASDVSKKFADQRLDVRNEATIDKSLRDASTSRSAQFAQGIRPMHRSKILSRKIL